jgi:hypothetical protein
MPKFKVTWLILCQLWALILVMNKIKKKTKNKPQIPILTEIWGLLPLNLWTTKSILFKEKLFKKH